MAQIQYPFIATGPTGGSGNLLRKLQPSTRTSVLRLGSATEQHTFWGAAAGPTAQIARIADRLFVGSAVVNDGIFYPDGGDGVGNNPSPSGFTDLDWLGQLSRNRINGGDGVGVWQGNDVNYSQFTVLADSASTPGLAAAPLIAITAGVQAKNSLTGASPRAFNGYAVKNHVAGQSVPVWMLYGEAHRVASGGGNTYGAEIEVRNSVDLIVGWNPYSQVGAGTIGYAIGAGCGLSATGQYDATCAFYITKNPTRFGAGIIFLDDAIGPHGTGSTRPAILMPYDNEIQWFRNGTTLGGTIKSLSGGGLVLNTGAGTITITSLPTSAAGLTAGMLWNDAGTVKVA